MISRTLLHLVPVLWILPAAIGSAVEFGPSTAISNYINYPDHVKAFDMDGDGDLDLIACGHWSGNVVWWENVGSGNFRRAGESQGSPLEFADFDGDGKIDLLVGYRDYSVSPVDGDFRGMICRGKGLAGFEPTGQLLPLRFSSSDVIVRDVNGDGRPDLLGEEGGWLNQGDGAFSFVEDPAMADVVWTRPDRRSWADDNGDGQPDLFLAEDHSVSRYTNLGNGKFRVDREVVTLEEGSDNRIDSIASVVLPAISPNACLLVAHDNGTFGGGTISLFVMRNGRYIRTASMLMDDLAGIKQLSTAMDGGTPRILLEFWSVKSGDYYNPVFRQTHLAEITIKTGKKDPSMAIKTLLEHDSVSSAPFFADLNGDGKSDLILPLEEYFGLGGPWYDQLVWFRQTKHGTFSKDVQEITQPAIDHAVRFAGDLDNDGDIDLLTDGAFYSSVPAVTIWRNSGHAESFNREEIFSRGDNAGVVDVADRNGDGRLDILIRSRTTQRSETPKFTNELILLISNKKGGYNQKVLLREEGDPWSDVELVDGNGDTIPDLHIFTYDNSHWLKGGAPYHFQPADRESGFLAHGEYRYDVDWDGDLDLWSPTYWAENDGTTSWPRHEIPGNQDFNIGEQFYSLHNIIPSQIDFDLDGHPDYLSVSEYLEAPLLAKGNGNFSDAFYPLSFDLDKLPTTPPFNRRVVNYLDVDLDQRLDAVYSLYVYDGVPAAIVWRKNLGTGFGEEQPIAAAAAFGRETSLMTDLDGDGIQDLVFSSLTGGRLEWFKGKAPQP